VRRGTERQASKKEEVTIGALRADGPTLVQHKIRRTRKRRSLKVHHGEMSDNEAGKQQGQGGESHGGSVIIIMI